MTVKNIVYIGCSLDGYIAGKNGELDWLDSIPIPEGVDMGFVAHMERIDALLMGRTTFETVCGFGGAWPYSKPVFVLSTTLTSIPDAYADKAQLVSGSLTNVLSSIHQKGYHNLYIDGGATVQSFLREDLIDEMIITTIPILLGGGARLFGDLPKPLSFELVGTEVFVNQIVQEHYRRKQN